MLNICLIRQERQYIEMYVLVSLYIKILEGTEHVIAPISKIMPQITECTK